MNIEVSHHDLKCVLTLSNEVEEAALYIKASQAATKMMPGSFGLNVHALFLDGALRRITWTSDLIRSSCNRAISYYGVTQS